MKPIRIRSAASQLRGAKVKANIAKGDAVCDALVVQVGGALGPSEREHVFAHPRRFRFDVAWVVPRIACEVHGGAYVRGGHHRAGHFKSDCEKGALALIAGWRVLTVMPEHVRSGQAAEWLRRIAERTP